MKTRIQVPLTLPEPHFEDEATVVSARQVVPLGPARVHDQRRKLFAILPLLLAAIFCGALGAIGVNYFERRVSAPTVSPPSTTRTKEEQQQTATAPSPDNSAVTSANSQDEPDTSEPSGSALASNSSASDKAENRPAKPEEAVASVKKPSSPTDPKQLVRPRRVHPPLTQTVPSQNDQPKPRGAGKIQDIFGGPNP